MYRQSLLVLLKILGLVGVLGAAAVGIAFLNQYVDSKKNLAEKTGLLELVDPPGWINQALKEKIYSAAQAGPEDLKLDQDAAKSVQQNIDQLVPWLADVQVQATHESLQIEGRWRKPLALVEMAGTKVYVDAELVVLDFLPLQTLPIVEVTGLSVQSPPKPGRVWQKDDLAAAVGILSLLDQRDSLLTPEAPLLFEIDTIDVSNFTGRQNRGAPHIVLYAKDHTPIIWGAEIDHWQQHLEVPDTDKIARLYTFYKQNGTILNAAKYINLCDPQDYVPQPVDKYQ